MHDYSSIGWRSLASMLALPSFLTHAAFNCRLCTFNDTVITRYPPHPHLPPAHPLCTTPQTSHRPPALLVAHSPTNLKQSSNGTCVSFAPRSAPLRSHARYLAPARTFLFVWALCRFSSHLQSLTALLPAFSPIQHPTTLPLPQCRPLTNLYDHSPTRHFASLTALALDKRLTWALHGSCFILHGASSSSAQAASEPLSQR